MTANKNLSQPANGSNVDDWDVPVNANWASIDSAFGDTVTINVVGATGTVALTSAQYIPPFIVLSGALTADVTYQLPNGVGGSWWITNNTSGAHSITFSSFGGGTTVVVAQGKKVDVICDKTNVFTGAASSGANADITSLSGLSTPLSVAQGGSGVATLSGVLKGNGTSAFTAATAGTDYVAPGTATSFTKTQSLLGDATDLGAIIANAAEPITVSATAATGTVNLYIGSQSLLYYTSSAAANWTVNLSFGSGHTLDSLLSAGQAITCVFLVTQGATAYYNSAVQVDGTTTGVTTKWLSGAPTTGHASGVDCYTYVIVKTGSATFTVFASQTSFF